jgi:ABC-type amino acid transport substrate-binding protein
LATRDVYVAISKGTSNEFIDNFRATFDELVTDGTYETLYSEYFE